MRITAVMTEAPSPIDADVSQKDPPGERELLKAVTAGDRSAAGTLVHSTYRQTWAGLFRLTGGDHELAADLTQETYRKAWASLTSFDGRSAFATWLFRIAYTSYLNHVRGPRRILPWSEESAARVVVQDASAEQVVTRTEEDTRLRRAVLDLPDPLRETVAARYWGEVSARQLAAAIGISETAVRKRLRKALTILKRQLEVEK